MISDYNAKRQCQAPFVGPQPMTRHSRSAAVWRRVIYVLSGALMNNEKLDYSLFKSPLCEQRC